MNSSDNLLCIVHILLQFYALTPDGVDSPMHKWALACWQEFIYWSSTVAAGCDDTCMQSRREHGAKLRTIAERLVRTLLEREQPNFCTVYMHIMTNHIEVCSCA